MKISIAMATYNGAQFIDEQLRSFAEQSRMPDELVVCDDLSTDGTVSIVDDFRRNAVFPVRLVQNSENLGYSKNFEKAISLCQGDIIFLSDQDDVWFPEKLAFVEGTFAANAKCMVVLNDQEIVDEHLTRTGETIYSRARAMRFGETWLTAGCCTAIRKDFLEVLLPIPTQYIAHDGWVHRVASSLSVRTVSPRVLQLYRRHFANTSAPLACAPGAVNLLTPIREYGIRDVTPAWKKEAELANILANRIAEKKASLSRLGLAREAGFAEALERQKSKLIRRRIQIASLGRLARIRGVVSLYQQGGYAQFAGWKSAFKDIIRKSARRGESGV